MPQFEQDREDLLREATALVDRAEFRSTSEPQGVVVGFRRNGAMSVYFGGEPVYQFNNERRLRRAYLDGAMLKPDRGRLVRLRRERNGRQVALIRETLDADQQAELLQAARDRMQTLAHDLAAHNFELHGEVSASGVSVIARYLEWMSGCSDPLEVAHSPRVGS